MILIRHLIPVAVAAFVLASTGIQALTCKGSSDRGNPEDTAGLETICCDAIVADPDAGALDEAATIRTSRQYFAEAKTASDADGGRTWGRPLYGPMIFIDEATRTLYANQPDQENRLK